MHVDEFIAVIAFVFAPPLAVGLVAQTWMFRRRGLFVARHAARVIASYALTVVGSFFAGLLIGRLAPPGVVHALGVHDIAIGGRLWPVMPLAFVAVAVASTMSIWWTLRVSRRTPAMSRPA